MVSSVLSLSFLSKVPCRRNLNLEGFGKQLNCSENFSSFRLTRIWALGRESVRVVMKGIKSMHCGSGGPGFQSEFYQLLARCLREGNGTPLQYFCLENPMDGGAW